MIFTTTHRQILHENVSQYLGLDKNIVIKGGFYTKPKLENLFATLPFGADKNSKVNFGCKLTKVAIRHNV